MASTFIIDQAWDMMDMSVVSRADLHICMIMFMENVRLGYEKYKGSGNVEIDYESLNTEMMELTPDERAEQAIMLMYIFAADHSKLIAAYADEDEDTFNEIISDDMERLFPEYSTEDEDTEDSESGNEEDSGDESEDGEETEDGSEEDGDSSGTEDDDSGDTGSEEDSGSEDEEIDDDSGSGTEDEDDEEEEETLPESNSTFSITIDSTESDEAADALSDEVQTAIEEEYESATFAAYLDEDSKLDEFLGIYSVTVSETGTSTLASPVAVTNDDPSGAIVLCYNEESDAWEEASDVQIVDGYVYASFSNEVNVVAVYTTAFKGEARVIIDDDTTCYDTLSEAITAANTASSSSSDIVIMLNSDVDITSTVTISNEYETASVMTFDLNNHTINADVADGYAIEVNSTLDEGYVYIQNGTISASANSAGTVKAVTSVKLIDMTLINYNGTNVEIYSANNSSYITGCSISSFDGCCVMYNNGDDAADMYITGDNNIFQVIASSEQSTFDKDNACLYINSEHTCYVNTDVYFLSEGTGITIDYNGAKIELAGTGSVISGDVAAIYITDQATENVAIAGGTFTGDLTTESGTATFVITGGSYSVEPDASYIASGYAATYNEESTMYVVSEEESA